MTTPNAHDGKVQQTHQVARMQLETNNTVTVTVFEGSTTPLKSP